MSERIKALTEDLIAFAKARNIILENIHTDTKIDYKARETANDKAEPTYSNINLVATFYIEHR